MDTDDIQSEIIDIRRTVADLAAALECAETCETRADVIANLDEAIEQADEALKALRALKKEV